MTVPPEREQEIREIAAKHEGWSYTDLLNDLLALLDEARRERDDLRLEQQDAVGREADLRAEVERLTRLGDALYDACQTLDPKLYVRRPEVAAWRDRDKEQA